jgi:hypothetical protein
MEARVDGYIVDIHRGDEIVEIQTANFSAIARKIRDLVTRHRVLLVHPVPRDRWIVKMPQKPGDGITRRKSPSHLGAIDVFSELVSFPELIGHPNFALDIPVIEEETLWSFAGRGRWRKRGWAMLERRLVTVYETVSLRHRGDYTSMIPSGLPTEFLTSDLADHLGRPRYIAQKVAYCLRNGGLIEKVGSRGNAILYAKCAPPAESKLRSPRRRGARATETPRRKATLRTSTARGLK